MNINFGEYKNQTEITHWASMSLARQKTILFQQCTYYNSYMHHQLYNQSERSQS